MQSRTLLLIQPNFNVHQPSKPSQFVACGEGTNRTQHIEINSRAAMFDKPGRVRTAYLLTVAAENFNEEDSSASS